MNGSSTDAGKFRKRRMDTLICGPGNITNQPSSLMAKAFKTSWPATVMNLCRSGKERKLQSGSSATPDQLLRAFFGRSCENSKATKTLSICFQMSYGTNPNDLPRSGRKMMESLSNERATQKNLLWKLGESLTVSPLQSISTSEFMMMLSPRNQCGPPI